MNYLIGLGVAIFSIVFSLVHLKQDVSQFSDPIALATVFGGTTAVFFMIFPWDYYKALFRCIRGIAIKQEKFDTKIKIASLKFLENRARGINNTEEIAKSLRPSVASTLLENGVELVGLGMEFDKIQSILKTRTQQSLIRTKRASEAIRSLAKYPPAFGLLGTVLGLVTMMREISSGSSSTEAGLKMSIALVATLYGILLSNLILNPLAEAMNHFLGRERNRAEFMIQTIKLYYEQSTQIESNEVIQSYFNPVNMELTDFDGANEGGAEEPSAPEAVA